MRLDPTDVAICIADDAVGDFGAPSAGTPAPTSVSTPTSVPIVQTSLFTFPHLQALIDGLADEHRHHVYTRGRNPTVAAVERKLARLERGEACKCFGSGMAAISAVLLAILRAGDHIVFVNQTYGPTLELAAYLERFEIAHDVVLDLDLDTVARAMRPNTRLLWMESPGTMTFRVLDIEAVAALARTRGALTCIDNSWATPLCQKPIPMGVDVVVHTCTKYLGGHSDLVAGAVISTAERIEEIFYRSYLLNGGILAPFDAWLLLRGLRTLPARLRQHEADALQIARFLAGHPDVRRVHHPALLQDRELVERQLGGYSGVFAFELKRDDFESVRTFIDALERFRIGVSWGGVESLVITPQQNDDGRGLERRGLPRGLVRLSVGLEGAEPLIADLESALARLA